MSTLKEDVSYSIISKASKKCLDAPQDLCDDGVRIQQWDFWGGNNQLWKLKRVNGYYAIMSATSEKCLDVEGASASDGAAIVQWTLSNQDNQLWEISQTGKGSYTIKSKMSGKVLDAPAGVESNGTLIQQWTPHGGDNQCWLFEEKTGVNAMDPSTKPMSLLQSIADWTAPICEGCGNRLFRGSNFAPQLQSNYKGHGTSDAFVARASFLCESCFQKRELVQCQKTGEIFFKHKDMFYTFLNSDIYRNLSPHHPSSRLRGAISPRGMALIAQEHDELQDRLRRWAGGTKFEQLRGYRILRELGVIKANADYTDVGSIEEALKWHALQIGGNGFIKFFWDKDIRHHEEEYVAGHGPKGNPFFRTRRWTTTYYTGHAVCVIAELLGQEPRHPDPPAYRKHPYWFRP